MRLPDQDKVPAFADDDLKRLKEHLQREGDGIWLPMPNCNRSQVFYFLTLLARLEAAEEVYRIARRVIESQASWNQLQAADNKWRKAAGK